LTLNVAETAVRVVLLTECVTQHERKSTEKRKTTTAATSAVEQRTLTDHQHVRTADVYY